MAAPARFRSGVTALMLIAVGLGSALRGDAQVERVTPVTDAILQNPDPATG